MQVKNHQTLRSALSVDSSKKNIHTGKLKLDVDMPYQQSRIKATFIETCVMLSCIISYE